MNLLQHTVMCMEGFGWTTVGQILKGKALEEGGVENRGLGPPAFYFPFWSVQVFHHCVCMAVCAYWVVSYFVNSLLKDMRCFQQDVMMRVWNLCRYKMMQGISLVIFFNSIATLAKRGKGEELHLTLSMHRLISQICHV